MSDQGIRILVIDGEGSPTIGVVPAVRVLDEMMSRIAFDDNTSPESILPCEYFDLIVGSGDGGWIALLLGRLGLSARRAKSVYEEIHTFIHRDCAGLNHTAKAAEFELRLKKLICEETKQNDPDLAALQEAKSTEPRCRVAVLTKAALNIGAPIILRTYHVRDNQTENCPIWAAIRACTAHPNVFPEVRLSEQTLISASLGHNNPIDTAMHEALAAFPNARVDCIVSLGSGHPGHSELQPANMDSFAKAAMELAQGSELVSQEFAKRRHVEGRGDTYFRFNVQQGLQVFAQPGYDSALAHVRAYLQDPVIGDTLNSAINSLRGESQNHLPVGPPLGDAEISRSEIIHASNAPPIQTYVYALYEEGFGLPLWDPQPLYKAKPVEIGDVGILTKLGAFQVLFNATLSAASQATMGYRIPPDFEPIAIVSSDIEVDPEVLQVPFLAHGDVIPSGQGLDSATRTRRPVQQPFNLSFAAMNGAALVIKDRPTEVTLTPERSIEEYIKNNCRSWYHYYEHDPQGPRRNLHGSSLIFVTAVVQNSQWALGAWSSLGTPIEVTYSGSATTGDGKFLDISGHWAPPGRRDVKQGPTEARGPARPRLRPEHDAEDLLAHLTQTLFVRGYVIGIRDTRPEILEPSRVYPLPYNSWRDILRKMFAYGIPAILRAAAEPQNLPPKPPPSPPQPPMALTVSGDGGSLGDTPDETNIHEFSPRRQLHHPTDYIMDAMFKMDPSLDIIVLHDNTIRDLIHGFQKDSVKELNPSGLMTVENFTLQNNPSKQGYLNSLPNDLLLYMFSICDARTIGKLRQCCRRFDHLSRDPTVWLDVLKRTCTDLSISMPSFFHKKALSQGIELLATTWIRFLFVLRNSPRGKPAPHKIVRSISITTRVLALSQSPDGQFLFVINGTGIRVWNLVTLSPTLVTSFAVDIPEDSICSVIAENETDSSLIVHLSIYARIQRLHQFLAFRMGTSSHHADGETQLQFLSQLDRVLFSSQRWGRWTTHSPMSMLCTTFEDPAKNRYYLLWDFVQGTSATWSTDAKDLNFESNIVLVRDFIVSTHNASGAVTVYALPEIPPANAYAPEICAKLSNPALLHIPAVPSSVRRHPVVSLNWTTSYNSGYPSSDREANASIFEIEDGSWLLERVELTRMEEPTEMFTPLPLKLERNTMLQIFDPRTFPISQDTSGRGYTYPDRSLLLDAPSKDGTTVVFHHSALAENSTGVGTELGRGVLYESHGTFEYTRKEYSLCSFAGRLCVVTAGGTIEVIDFVESPYLRDIPTIKRGGKRIPISETFGDSPTHTRRSSFSSISNNFVDVSTVNRRNSFH